METRLNQIKHVEDAIAIAAAKIMQEIDASCLVTVQRVAKEDFEDSADMDVKVSIFRKIRKDSYGKVEYTTRVRKVSGGSIIPIKELLMEAINKEYIKKDERVVCASNETMGLGYKGLLFVFDVDKVFFDISTHKLAENIKSEVIEAVINISLELSREGREGKRVGTAFVIGETDVLGRYTKQLIINPFAGYDKELRKITDTNMRETIKEFAQLDGVFVIDREGTIISAGTYLDINTEGVSLYGYGTKHRTCAALTARTDSIAIVISESGGIVTVFKDGRAIIKLP